MAGQHDGEATTAQSWSACLADDAPDGLALVDAERRFVQVNRAGARLLGQNQADLVGTAAPFSLADAGNSEPVGLFADGSGEQVMTLAGATGLPREFAYRAHRRSGDPDLTVVAFRDVTDEHYRRRRIATLARAATKLATEGSLPAILDELAKEVLRTDALAGVQILIVDDDGRGQRVMGSAGFRRRKDFFERLIECEQRSGSVGMLEALRRNEPVVIPNLWATIESDPAREPLRDCLGELKWESFASVPLIVRGRPTGVLNAFFAPGQDVEPCAVEFLGAMAEQAAIAVDYATLLHRERGVACREQRQQLGRDLHDSIVQQVFSISMQTKSLEVIAERGDTVSADSVRRVADEVGMLSTAVLADLRKMMHELRLSSTEELGGLPAAVRALAESTTDRAGLRFGLSIGGGLDAIQGELAEDVYRIIAEAIHNVVKHAEADNVTIRLSVRAGRVTASITDDGRGFSETEQGTPGPRSGHGLRTMRERAQRWGGSVSVKPASGEGTVVRIVVPLPVGVPPTGQLPVGVPPTGQLPVGVPPTDPPANRS